METIHPENQPLKIRILKVLVSLGITYVLFMAGIRLGFFLVKPMTSSANRAVAFAGLYAAMIGLWFTFLGFCAAVKNQRHLFSKLGRRETGNNLKTALLIGLPLGLGMNLLIALVALIQGNITLTFRTFDPLMLLLFILVVFIQSCSEELMARWFIYENVKRWFPKTPAVPILVNAGFFMILHLFNDGITWLSVVNLVLVGILYSLLVYYYHSIWAAVVAHTTWNFCQNIILGLPNSGQPSDFSIFTLDAAKATNGFAYDTGFGLEGSVLTLIFLGLACLAIIWFGKKRQARA